MPLSSDDVACITAFFEYVDADHTGFITPLEIEAACAVDVNDDGVTDRAEIVASAKAWIDAFAAQDLDADQKITLHELLAYNES